MLIIFRDYSKNIPRIGTAGKDLGTAGNPGVPRVGMLGGGRCSAFGAVKAACFGVIRGRETLGLRSCQEYKLLENILGLGLCGWALLGYSAAGHCVETLHG